MEALTPKQEEILSAIRSYVSSHKQSPTIREIGSIVNLRSSCSVQKQIETLERFGKIRRGTFKYRSIELVDDPIPVPIEVPSLPIPVFGKAAGGLPIEAMQDIQPELITLPTSLLPRIDQNRQRVACEENKFVDVPLFALQVVGRSMVDVGIDDGDLVIVRTQSDAQDGEIVVALLEEEEATVKKYYRENGVIRLQPANDAYSPIYSEFVKIIGKVILSIKRF